MCCTIAIGGSVLPQSDPKNVCSATGPPVDTPTATRVGALARSSCASRFGNGIGLQLGTNRRAAAAVRNTDTSSLDHSNRLRTSRLSGSGTTSATRRCTPAGTSAPTGTSRTTCAPCSGSSPQPGQTARTASAPGSSAWGTKPAAGSHSANKAARLPSAPRRATRGRSPALTPRPPVRAAGWPSFRPPNRGPAACGRRSCHSQRRPPGSNRRRWGL